MTKRCMYLCGTGATGKEQGTGTELPKVLRQFQYAQLISAGVHCQSSALVVPCSSEAGYYISPWTSHVTSHHKSVF
ncbi:hypothetical protein TNCV_4514191 [Trichonephila clavipes]|nr:hypothetical protein TNCV_4514191 [Trichonephila clavipes]